MNGKRNVSVCSGHELANTLYSLLNGVTSWRSCPVVPLGCVNRIRLWPLRHDDHSGVLIGQRACRLMAEARESIERMRSGTSGSPLLQM